MDFYSSSDQRAAWQKDIENPKAVVPTGFPEFDKYLERGGIRAGTATALLGRPGVGKTGLAVAAIDNMVKDGEAVLFSSQEMSVAEVVARLLAMRNSIPVWELMSRWQSGDFALRRAVSSYEKTFPGLRIYTKHRPTFQDIRTAWVRAGSPPVIVQDFTNRMAEFDWDGNKLFGSKKDRVEEIAWGFKVMAKELGCAVLVLTQVGRSADGSDRKNLGHLALTPDDAMYGGEESYDVMLGMFRPGKNPDRFRDDLLDGTKSEQDRYHRARALGDKYGMNPVVQVLKNRFGDENLQGHMLQVDWKSMKFVSPMNHGVTQYAGDAM